MSGEHDDYSISDALQHQYSILKKDLNKAYEEKD
jgi:hypothetical protein